VSPDHGRRLRLARRHGGGGGDRVAGVVEHRAQVVAHAAVDGHERAAAHPLAREHRVHGQAGIRDESPAGLDLGPLTQQEIAARTDTPLGTVKSRMRSGLMAMRRAIEGGTT
jgi:hypothetical protein